MTGRCSKPEIDSLCRLSEGKLCPRQWGRGDKGHPPLGGCPCPRSLQGEIDKTFDAGSPTTPHPNETGPPARPVWTPPKPHTPQDDASPLALLTGETVASPQAPLPPAQPDQLAPGLPLRGRGHGCHVTSAPPPLPPARIATNATIAPPATRTGPGRKAGPLARPGRRSTLAGRVLPSTLSPWLGTAQRRCGSKPV